MQPDYVKLYIIYIALGKTSGVYFLVALGRGILTILVANKPRDSRFS